jgi:hypothetical protein
LEEAIFSRGKSFSGFFLVPWDYAAIVGAKSPEEKAQGVVFLLFPGLPFFLERVDRSYEVWAPGCHAGVR